MTNQFLAVSNPSPDIRAGGVILNLSHRDISKINLRLRLACTTRIWQKHWKMTEADNDDKEIDHILESKDSNIKAFTLRLKFYRLICNIVYIVVIY